MIRCEDKVWGEVMCEKQKNLSEKLQLVMYAERFREVGCSPNNLLGPNFNREP